MNEILNSKPLAQGRTADVYPYGDGQVLKLFHEWVGQDGIEYEARLAQAVHAGGLPVPAVGEIVQVDGRNGLVYERVDGRTMLEYFRRQPWRLNAYARQLGSLHQRVHTITGNDLPAQRMILEWKISHASVLSRLAQDKLIAELNTLPDGEQVCHGDFHPGNVMITPDGAIIIDWSDASSGNPLADVARTVIIMLGAAASEQAVSPLEKRFLRLFVKEYLNNYFKDKPQAKVEYARWLPVVAAARLSENIPEIQAWLVSLSQGDEVIIY